MQSRTEESISAMRLSASLIMALLSLLPEADPGDSGFRIVALS